MGTLLDVTNTIIDHDDPTKLLRKADDYCFAYRRMGADSFVLPAVDAFLLPIIEAYAHRPQAFLRYVQVIRDEVHAAYRGNKKAEEMQEFYRGLVVRITQAEIRERRKQIVEWLVHRYPNVSTQQKNLWARRVELQWTKLRRAILESERKQAGGRLPMTRVSEITEEFWNMVDEDIKNGNLPPLE